MYNLNNVKQQQKVLKITIEKNYRMKITNKIKNTTKRKRTTEEIKNNLVR